MIKKKKSYAAEYPHTLNVLFHGLWAYELEDNGLVIRTPPEANHRVAAGSWIPEADLRDGATYQIEGIADGGSADFKPESNAIFTNQKLVSGAKVYCTIRLPFPKEINSVRPISFHKDKPPYVGADAHLVTTREIAIVQVFTYAANLPLVRLVEAGKTAQPAPDIHPFKLNGKPGVANLYLFAQPDNRVHSNHFEEAFAKLAALYGLDIVPVPSIPRGPRTPPITGVSWRDLVGLNERAMFQGELVPAGGSSGSNCDPFIVDNRNGVPRETEPAVSQVHQPAHPERAQGRSRQKSQKKS